MMCFILVYIHVYVYVYIMLSLYIHCTYLDTCLYNVKQHQQLFCDYTYTGFVEALGNNLGKGGSLLHGECALHTMYMYIYTCISAHVCIWCVCVCVCSR